MANYGFPVMSNYQGPYDMGGVDAPQMAGQLPPSVMQRMKTAFTSNPDLAMALLANSGYSPQKRSFGEILGTSMMQANQMKSGREDDAFKRKYMEAQMAAMGGNNRAPSSVQEYEYAKKNGYKGSYQDWTVMGGQNSRPSSVQEWEFYNALPQDQKPLYLEMKRNPNFTVKDVNQVPTSIQQSIVGGVSAAPLSTLPATAAAAETVKQSEGRGAAVGKAQGEITGGIETKGANATTVQGMLDIAEPLIDVATGSKSGAAYDAVASVFGGAPDGAKAIASLQVLQAGLMTNMPRMEGPQSDADVALYRQAAGQIGDPGVPRDIKKAALRTIRELQKKYQDRATGNYTAPKTSTPTNNNVVNWADLK